MWRGHGRVKGENRGHVGSAGTELEYHGVCHGVNQSEISYGAQRVAERDMELEWYGVN